MVLDVVDQVKKLDECAVLTHFCQKGSAHNHASTELIIVQSMIFQVMAINCKQFSTKDSRFTRQRFEHVRNDLEKLWRLFVELIETVENRCIWLMIDKLNHLQSQPGGDREVTYELLKKLNALIDDSKAIVKILITTRSEISGLSLSALDETTVSSRAAEIKVPRGRYKKEARLAARRSKQYIRLPDRPVDEDAVLPVDDASIDALLFATESESDDSQNLLKISEAASKMESSPSTKHANEDDGTTTDTDLSIDPFAESPDSDEAKSVNKREPSLHSCSSDESLMGERAFVARSNSNVDDNPFEESSSDSDKGSDESGQPVISPLTPRIVVAPADPAPTKNGCAAEGGESDNVFEAYGSRHDAEANYFNKANAVQKLETKGDLESESDRD